MPVVAFDTHAYVKRLTGAGMPEPQAEALAEEQSRLIENELSTKRDIEMIRLDIEVTRRDIKELETRLEGKLAEVRREIKELETRLEGKLAEVRRDIRESEHRMTIRLGGMLAVAIGVVTALVKLL